MCNPFNQILDPTISKTDGWMDRLHRNRKVKIYIPTFHSYVLCNSDKTYMVKNDRERVYEVQDQCFLDYLASFGFIIVTDGRGEYVCKTKRYFPTPFPCD